MSFPAPQFLNRNLIFIDYDEYIEEEKDFDQH